MVGRKLSARRVATASTPGRYADGGGLYLQVGPNGGKAWLFRYSFGGRRRQMGLGEVDLVSLAEARERALSARRLVHDGVDPIEDRRARRLTARLKAAKAVTFADAARRYVAAHEAGWRNPKHVQQWRSTLETYACPHFGGLPVQAVDTDLVLRALDPIWRTKPETASRLRGRIEAILDWARVRGLRDGENPARWRGHLDALLPAPSKVRPGGHHPALPWREVPAFMSELRVQSGIAARALELLVLTTSRTGEVLGATWDEVDLAGATWTIPARRMKGGRAHRVPLSAPALAVLHKMSAHSTDGLIFPGRRPDRPLSNMAMPKLLDRMGHGEVTIHGFRSSFRDWAGETSDFPREVVEQALAHAIGDKVEAAYRRGDLFEKRRELMDSWAAFCDAEARTGAVALPGGRHG